MNEPQRQIDLKLARKAEQAAFVRRALFAVAWLLAGLAAAWPAWAGSMAASSSFSPSTISAGSSSTLTFSISNGTHNTVTAVGFTDTMPSGLTITGTPTYNSRCGTPSITSSSGSIAVSGASISANKTCQIYATVTACTQKTYNDSAFTVSWSGGSTSNSPESLTVSSSGSVSASSSTIAADPATVTADGTSTSTITVTLTDSCGNPVSGKRVSLSAGSGSSTISPSSVRTNSSGQAVFTVKDSVVESVTYTARDTSDGITLSNTVTVAFVATVRAPTAATSAATSVTSTNGGWTATLNGKVSSNGADTTVSFEFGTSTSYGTTIAADSGCTVSGGNCTLTSSASNVSVSASSAVIGLNCNTTFHYRVKAVNSAGTTYGSDETFTTGACVAPFSATACAGERFGENLVCTANDVNLTGIKLAPGSISSCVAGAPVTLDLDMTVNFASPDRYDIGIFVANDGKDPQTLPASGGATSCSVDILPITQPASGDTFYNVDPGPWSGVKDTCGDGNDGLVGVKRMTGVSLPCYASATSGGKLYVPFVVSWDNQSSPIGGTCSSNRYPVPNTKSKCNAPNGTVAIDVVVLPKVTITDGIDSINPGASTVYLVTVFNDSGGTLQDMALKLATTTADATTLGVSGVTCSVPSGSSAVCPASGNVTVANLQGSSGISIPSASLPDGSKLTFTVVGTLSSTAAIGTTLATTASVSIGTPASTATDSDMIVQSPTAAMTFTTNPLIEGNATQMTITFTNPLGYAITGVGFTDSYPSGMTNSGTPSAATTCTGATVTATASGTSLVLSGATIPAAADGKSGTCAVTVNVTGTATGSPYLNSTGTIATTSPVSISAASATLTVNTAVYGGFNACDYGSTTTTCTNKTDLSGSTKISVITTKVAGTAFQLTLVALKSDGTRDTNYNKTVTVELLDASTDDGTRDSYNCNSSWTAIPGQSSTATFNLGNGLANTGTFTVSSAYKVVRVRVSIASPANKGCSTDAFAIRPSGFTIAVTDSDWATAGTTRTLNNTSATTASGNMHKAGQPFTITVTAANASNYTGIPGTDSIWTIASCTNAAADTACIGTHTSAKLSSGSWSTASGVATTSTASYADVGAFTLELEDQTFANIDATDGSAATCSGRYICSSAIDVGRFVPDRYTVTNNNGKLKAYCNGFSYTGQPIGYEIVPSLAISAVNASGAVTTNYTGNLQKLTASGIKLTKPTSDATRTGKDGAKTALLADMSSGTLPNAISGSMTYTLKDNDTFTYTRSNNTLIEPYATDVQIAVSEIKDGDGVTATGPLDALKPENINLRYGRLRTFNAYGSELLAMQVPVRAEYFDGKNWQTNTLDGCTDPGTGAVALSPATYEVSAFAKLDKGMSSIVLKKPNAAGSLDLAVNLGATGSGNDNSCNGSHGGSPANADWLRYDWCTGNNDPNAHVTFGTPKARYIYLREKY